MQILTVAHVATGAFAVAAGALALSARKGGGVHIGAGRGFAGLMAVSSGLGAWLGLVNAETLYITFHAGVLACCLIASGWLAARAAQGPAVAVVGVVNLANLAALIVLGSIANSTVDGSYLGFAAENYFFLAGMAGLAAAGDATLPFRRTLSERHRIARHLWRMCFGFFIAAGSAFTGPGAQAFPEALRQSGLLSLPELLIIAAMLFWLVRVLVFRRRAVGDSRG